MNTFLNFLRKSFGRKSKTPAHSHTDDIQNLNQSKKNKKSDIECHVIYLDGTEQIFYVSVIN